MTVKTKQLSSYYTDLYKEAMDIAQKGQLREAIKKVEEIIALRPKEAAVYIFCSMCYGALGELNKAVEITRLGIEHAELQPDLYKYGTQYYYLMGAYKEAYQFIDEGLDAFPGNELLLFMHTVVVGRLPGHDSSKARKMLLELLDKNPDNHEALVSMGSILSAEEEIPKSTEYLVRSLRVKPDYVPAIIKLADNLVKLKDESRAVNLLDSALKINPDAAMALLNKSLIMGNHGLVQEAMPILNRGLDLLGGQNDDKSIALIYFSNKVFYIHYVPDVDRKEIFDLIQEWYELNCGHLTPKPRLSFDNKVDKNKKLRVGFISFSFVRHPVTWMTLAALDNLDRSQFELICYSDVKKHKQDDVTKRYYEMCDEVYDLKGMGNSDVVEKIRNDKIDILFELTGHSEGGKRLPVAAERVAPVQVKWVGGLFNTTGVPAIDWILGDKIEIPEGDEKWYTERVYRMPDDYIVYEPPKYVDEVSALPALKNGYVTFANTNNLTKTNSYTVELWSKILKAVPRSRLLMKLNKLDTPFAMQHFEEAFAKHGIGIDRLVFEGGSPHKIFMETYHRIDIVLDPHPYTGGLTTCEALWMGAPVITLPGETFAGRHAATHLYNAGMEDWIAKDEDDYIALAVKWANDLEGLAKLRAGLREKVRNSPLCDGPRFARNFEKAMRFMWEDWCDEKLSEKSSVSPAKVIKPPKPKKKRKKK
ncbi:MAG: tetratricopeptide repeat protein [Alphaproteobacteria bacterium]|nr:tetratricopeptide repeat protein [Alphaproteobacteria bacterium]